MQGTKGYPPSACPCYFREDQSGLAWILETKASNFLLELSPNLHLYFSHTCALTSWQSGLSLPEHWIPEKVVPNSYRLLKATAGVFWFHKDIFLVHFLHATTAQWSCQLLVPGKWGACTEGFPDGKPCPPSIPFLPAGIVVFIWQIFLGLLPWQKLAFLLLGCKVLVRQFFFFLEEKNEF
jgi:hypothetical protein